MSGIVLVAVALGAILTGASLRGSSPAAADPTVATAFRPPPAPVDASNQPVLLCPIPWWNGPRQVRRLVECAATYWHSPGGPKKAEHVAWCESRFQATVVNVPGCGGAGCGGVFQQHLGFRPDRARRLGFGGHSALDAWANVIVSVRMAANRGTWALDWPICGR